VYLFFDTGQYNVNLKVCTRAYHMCPIILTKHLIIGETLWTFNHDIFVIS